MEIFSNLVSIRSKNRVILFWIVFQPARDLTVISLYHEMGAYLGNK